MGSQTSGQAHPNYQAQSLSAEMAAVALIPAKTCAAIGSASVSWWHEEVRSERAPKPVISQPRFTRWKASDVIAFWAARADAAAGEAHIAEAVTARAKKASAAAQAKRVASQEAA